MPDLAQPTLMQTPPTVLDERRQLGRALHNGVAQDLAALGFAIDGLRAQAQATAPLLVSQVADLRTQLGTVISLLRVQIRDLDGPP